MKKIDFIPLLLLCAILVAGILTWYLRLPCIFYECFGLFCPGCGTTRAVDALLRGKLLLALQNNAPAVLLLPPVALCLFLWAFPKPRTSLKKIGSRIPKPAVWLLLLLLLLYTVLRNFPVCAFLAPFPAT